MILFAYVCYTLWFFHLSGDFNTLICSVDQVIMQSEVKHWNFSIMNAHDQKIKLELFGFNLVNSSDFQVLFNLFMKFSSLQIFFCLISFCCNLILLNKLHGVSICLNQSFTCFIFFSDCKSL